MSLFALYLLIMLDRVEYLFVGIMLSIVLITFMLSVIYAEDIGKVVKVLKRGFAGFLTAMLLMTLIPNTKQAMLIVGGYYVTNLEDINKLPDNTVRAINTFLEEYNLQEPPPQD
jgi:hypothetical protein